MKHKAKHGRTLQIAFLMDVMEKILFDEDTSVSIMREAERRGHQIYYIEPDELFWRGRSVYADARQVSVAQVSGFQTLRRRLLNLKTCDVIFNRKEPPFNLAYLYLTQMLELLTPEAFVINSPEGIRGANEKLYILEFDRWIPPTLVSNRPEKIERFWREKKTDLILKPLDQKGGAGIDLLKQDSKQARHILKEATADGTRWIMAQKFLKQNLKEGDKRILLLNGKVLGQFRRIPKAGEFRSNLSLGGKYVRTRLTSADRKLVRAIAPKLTADGLYFVGLDVIDGKLIEINVTSPAGIPEINALEGTRLEVRVVDFLEKKAGNHSR
ncbi:MAG: glutathione synthase [Candidatus Omnitrophica bacterium]|nr:glutathione synthase [Candidatus Omnitrophota bacterium]